MKTWRYRHALREMLPPVVIRLVGSLSGARTRFHGDYSSWVEACGSSGGYSDAGIVDRVRAATLKVKRGEACFERDGTVFYTSLPNFPVLVALLDAAVTSNGRLRVLDFGGALGGTYYQTKPYLKSVKNLEWCVVEQPRFVEYGRKDFETAELRFFGSVSECVEHGVPSVALFSSVLQYLEDPRMVISQVTGHCIERIVFDRTPLIVGECTRLTVQHVPKYLGGSSYPAWLFTETDLIGLLPSDYRRLYEFAALDGSVGSGVNTVDFKGFYFIREKDTR